MKRRVVPMGRNGYTAIRPRQRGAFDQNLILNYGSTGFRAMASTHLNEQGYNRDWIERQLAHSERNSIRAAYNYAEYLPERRKMMQDYADHLDGLKRNYN